MTRPRSDARYTSPETWVTDSSSPPASRPRRIGRTSHLALAGSGHLRRRGRSAFGLMRARGFAAVDAEFAGYRLLAVACGVPGSYRLFQKTRPRLFECLDCGRQTSLTAGTVMHRSRLPLTTWFQAAHLMTTHSNGMSALQLEAQLGVTYKTAWLLTQKLRRSMIDPNRDLLEGVVEVDQTHLRQFDLLSS